MPTVKPERISSAEAARRLGVKVETVYAYVSRGLLTSRRVHGGRGSTFSITEVEALAGSGMRHRGGDSEPFRFPSISTGIALVTADGLYFRGVDAVTLSAERSFEEVAAWIWTGELRAEPFVAPAVTTEAVRNAVRALPGNVDPTARLRVAVAVASALDHLRFDLTPESVRHMGRTVIACMVDGLTDGPADNPAGVADRLWAALSSEPDRPELRACLQAALVLLADRGLAASTVAARAAASARAHPYAVVSAGLGALDGPLHGGASAAARQLLDQVLATGDVDRTLADYLRLDRPVPGLGLYNARTDPRATALLARLGEIPAAAEVVTAVRSIAEALRPRGAYQPNVDLALAALSIAGGLRPGSGEAIFAVARSVGWIGHALEEYREQPLRWRGRELYTGPQPD
ncbi:MAG TPA: citrate synthase [Mycobacteriales bacterium]|nr:citrate synthase [Mycobacteriales bacterium]